LVRRRRRKKRKQLHREAIKAKRQGFTTVPLFFTSNDSINNGKEIVSKSIVTFRDSKVLPFHERAKR
jgi:hypothetical protein